MNNPQELTALEKFTDILDKLGINYAIGGSMASSAYGSVRFTEDADVMVEPFDDKAEEFIQSLKPEYYISKDAILYALKQHSSFNIIHIESVFKIDIFVRKDTDFEEQLMLRRRPLKLSDSLKKTFSVVSPEDIILIKLCWYRDGNYSSNQQWKDVLGVFNIQAEQLDVKYLKKWASKLYISELLEKAISEILE